jgi:hypothetical protein
MQTEHLTALTEYYCNSLYLYPYIQTFNYLKN